MGLQLTTIQTQQLSEKASGLFIWCATVFRYIEIRRSPGKDTIDAILSPSSHAKGGPFDPLYESYQRVLDSAASDNEDKVLVESVLSVIFVSSNHQPSSSESIADVLYPNELGEGRIRKRTWVANIIAYLFAIIHLDTGTKTVRMCHYSDPGLYWRLIKRGTLNVLYYSILHSS